MWPDDSPVWLNICFSSPTVSSKTLGNIFPDFISFILLTFSAVPRLSPVSHLFQGKGRSRLICGVFRRPLLRGQPWSALVLWQTQEEQRVATNRKSGKSKQATECEQKNRPHQICFIDEGSLKWGTKTTGSRGAVILVRVSDLRLQATLTFGPRLSQTTNLKESNNNQVLSPSIHHSEMRVMHCGSSLT